MRDHGHAPDWNLQEGATSVRMSGLNFFGKVRDMVGYGEMGDEDLVAERKRERCANGGHVAGASSEN
jgi:hypothetical protein